MVFENVENVAGNDDILSITLLPDSILQIDDTIQSNNGKKTLIKKY